MDFIRKNKYIVFAILIALIVFAFYFIRNYRAGKTIYNSQINEPYEEIPKTYGVNEYMRVSVSEDMMARTYFNDFKSSVINEIDKSYLLIDNDYRKAKFSNLDDYKNYIRELNLGNAKIVKYNVSSKNGKRVYIVYDSNNHYYAFKIDGVMQYTVYLDDYTVEIR